MSPHKPGKLANPEHLERSGRLMLAVTRWVLIAGILGITLVAPAIYFRSVYAHGKRLREVDPGKVYRSGEMTAEGFTDAVHRLGIRTIINFRDDFPDPDVQQSYLNSKTIKESELCKQLGVQYVFIPPDLISRNRIPEERPVAIDKFLAVMDDQNNYPVLLHCMAGLNRTGIMTAVYRMEYNGWDPGQAIKEVKANGFGEWGCTTANDYIKQYITTYRPGIRKPLDLGRWAKDHGE